MTTGARQRWGPIVLVTIAVAFGVTLRWWQLGARSLWFDEGYTAWVVSLPPAKIVEVIHVDTAPPLYYLLMRGWVRLAGTGEAALRVPSAACATAALAVMAAVVCRLFQDRWARAAAVALVACSFMQVAYAHEVRFYAMMALLGAADFYLAIRACEQERPAWGWLAAAAAAWAGSLWLNNIMVIYLAALGPAWLVLPGRRPTRGRVRDVVVVAAVAAVAFAPWVPAMVGQRRAMRNDFWTHRPRLWELWDMLKWVVGVSEVGGRAGGTAVAVAAVATAALARRRWRVVAAVAVFALGPIFLTFVYSQRATSIFIDRAFVVSSLVVPLLAAVPLEVTVDRGRRALAGGLVAWLLAAAVLSAVADRHGLPNHLEDWRGASRYAAGLSVGHRLVVFNANEGELLYDYYARGGDYAPGPGLTGTPAGYFDRHPPRTMRRVRTDAEIDGLRQRLDARPADDVVFVATHIFYSDAGGRTLALLRGRMRLAGVREFDAITVYRFVPMGPASRPTHLGR